MYFIKGKFTFIVEIILDKMITKDRSESLLDKDWGAKIPDYITKGTFSVAVFFLSLFMRGGLRLEFVS